MDNLIDRVTCGDAFQLGEQVRSESVDLILCDPLWWEVDHYLWLSRFGKRVLKPFRYCLAQTGSYYLFDNMKAMADSLDYYWLISEPLNQATAFFKYKIVQYHKPILWFANGIDPSIPDWRRWALDRVFSAKSKSNHEYEDGIDSMIITIERLTKRGDLVVDPFACTGTVAAACKILDRRCISFEIDPDRARMAQDRVDNLTPPLLVPDPIQLNFEDSL